MNTQLATKAEDPVLEPGLQVYDCSCCGSKEFRVLHEATLAEEQEITPDDFDCTNPGHGEHFRVVRCLDCGMVYCSPRPTFEDLLKAYSGGEDETYVREEAGRVRTFRRALKDFTGIRSGRLLDVGCNTGVFLEQAKAVGFECFGVEPSRYAAEKARSEKGFDVFQGAVPCELPWSQDFDVVTLWDVIEHLDDPLETLSFLRGKIRDGGELHLSTMDFSSVYAKLAGKKWPWLMRMHIQYFDKRSMKEMLLRAGYSKVEITSYRHIVHSSYLKAKLKNVAPVLRLIGTLGAGFFSDSEGFVTVNMGDMMHVTATA